MGVSLDQPKVDFSLQRRFSLMGLRPSGLGVAWGSRPIFEPSVNSSIAFCLSRLGSLSLTINKNAGSYFRMRAPRIIGLLMLVAIMSLGILPAKAAVHYYAQYQLVTFWNQGQILVQAVRGYIDIPQQTIAYGHKVAYWIGLTISGSWIQAGYCLGICQNGMYYDQPVVYIESMSADGIYSIHYPFTASFGSLHNFTLSGSVDASSGKEVGNAAIDGIGYPYHPLFHLYSVGQAAFEAFESDDQQAFGHFSHLQYWSAFNYGGTCPWWEDWGYFLPLFCAGTSSLTYNNPPYYLYVASDHEFLAYYSASSGGGGCGGHGCLVT